MVIKVKRSELMRSMGARMRKITEEFQKEKQLYEENRARIEKQLLESARDLVKRMEGGNFKGLDRQFNGTSSAALRGVLPEKPSLNGEYCRLEGDLARLRLSADEFVRLRDNDKMLSYLDGKECKR